MRKKVLKNNEDKNIIDTNVSDKKIRAKKTTKKLGISLSNEVREKNVLTEQKLSNSLNSSNGAVIFSSITNLKLCVNVPSDKSFILCDGRSIFNCKELADVLLIIGDDLFGYHVNDNKNDFANWINDVFEDLDLAKKISHIRNRIEMSALIYKHIFELLERG